MRIVYFAAGAAGMYCGSCLHDNTLASALIALGDDVLLMPTYTPIRTDEADVSQRRVLLGGINVYLQQVMPFLRHMPRFLNRLLDSPRLLGWLSKLQLSVDAAKLGGLTVSVLRGEMGNQRKELDKLIDWLKREAMPDVVHLSNAMLIGLARRIKDELGVPVLCTLSGEDIFLEKLQPPHYAQARDELRSRAADIEAFVALNHYYADYMADYLSVARERIRVIPHGLKLAGHGDGPRLAPSARTTLGYLARICPDKGLEQLVDAFHLLRQDPRHASARLRVAGYLGAADRPYLEKIQSQVKSWGLESAFEYVGEVSRQGKIDFLQSLDLFCLPTIYRESKGLSVLEAMANGVPVVLPAHGCFPELIDETRGGVLFPPNDVPALARALSDLLIDGDRARGLGLAGQQAIRARFSDQLMAQRHQLLYRDVLATWAGASRTGPAPVTLPGASR